MSVRIALLLILFASTLPAQSQNIDRAALNDLEKACTDSHSSSYVVLQNGTPVVSFIAPEAPKRIGCHSVLKSIASLAVGKLIAEGAIDSLDTPVYAFFPEWKQGYRKGITIRHLLNHTSGLLFSESTMDEWSDAPDYLQVALCADLVSLPGDHFNYNNKAFMLLLGLIGRAATMPTHQYFETALFRPLGISNYEWTFDQAGNTTGLMTSADELARIGQLVLEKGMWNGRRLIPAEWIDLSFEPGQPYVANCGLMWWRIPERTTYIVDDAFLGELRQAELPEELIRKFEALKGTYTDVNIDPERLAAVFGHDWQGYLDREFYPYFPARSRREYSAEVIGYKAEGWLGQYIVIVPEKGLVAVRMIDNTEDYAAATDEFRDFERYVYRLVR